jgi:uncharacterized BrkB/YihY/UPF0761 family membrane protein
VVSGPAARAVGEAIGLGDTAVTIWSIAKWPVLLGLAAVVVAILIFLLWLRITNLALLFGAELKRRDGTRSATSGRDTRRGRHSAATPRH